jgi:hypothetical protein
MHTRLLLAVGLGLALSPLAAAQVSNFDLTLDANVSIGDSFAMCIDAPEGWVVVLLLSGNAGVTPTPYGPLAIEFPTLWETAFYMPPGGPFCMPTHFVICDTGLVGVIGHFQFLAFDTQNPSNVGISNAESIAVVDNGVCSGDGAFVTFTQGGWGAACSGMNAGCIRDANFATSFPGGMILGDPDGVDGDGEFALVLTSAAAVENFLRDGGTAQALTGNEVDVTNSSAGVLAGQLVAATLNVIFDDDGVFDAMKSDPSKKLRDLIYVSCVDNDLDGMTVGEILDIGNAVISGVILPIGLDHMDISGALDVLNMNFDNGTQNLGCLAFAGP